MDAAPAVDPDETLPPEYGVACALAKKAGYVLEVRMDQERYGTPTRVAGLL